jgi:hypothetical protein
VIYRIYHVHNHKKYTEKFGDVSVPQPIIYLPLTNYYDTKTYIDIYNNPVVVNGLGNNDFDENNGVKFDGSPNKYIQTSDLVGSYTICFSLYLNAITPNSFIFNQGTMYTSDWMNGLGMFLSVQDSSTLYLGTYDSILYTGTGVTGTSEFLNNWSFITVVVKPGISTILYVNGFPYPKKPNNSKWSTGSFILGGQTLNGSSFKGFMRNFMVFGTALSQYQIYGLHEKSKSTDTLQDILSPLPLMLTLLNNGDIYQNGPNQLVFNPLSGYIDNESVQTLNGYTVLDIQGNILGVITMIQSGLSLPSKQMSNALYVNLSNPWPIPIDSMYYLKSPVIKSNVSSVSQPEIVEPSLESEIINYLTIDNYKLQFLTIENINTIKLDFDLLSVNLKKLGNIRTNNKIKTQIKKLNTLLLSLYISANDSNVQNTIVDIYGLLTNL